MDINWLVVLVFSGFAFFPLVAVFDPALRKQR